MSADCHNWNRSNYFGFFYCQRNEGPMGTGTTQIGRYLWTIHLDGERRRRRGGLLDLNPTWYVTETDNDNGTTVCAWEEPKSLSHKTISGLPVSQLSGLAFLFSLDRLQLVTRSMTVDYPDFTGNGRREKRNRQISRLHNRELLKRLHLPVWHEIVVVAVVRQGPSGFFDEEILHKPCRAHQEVPQTYLNCCAS